jgi:ubiquitin carboxyl-terminal hydrolase 9/24
MITNSIADYHELTRRHVAAAAETDGKSAIVDVDSIQVDGRFNHSTQIHERLNFLKYILKEGELFLNADQAETIWKCLALSSAFEVDREICFKWYSKLMSDDPFLDPEIITSFFVNYVTKLDPALITDSGIKCFDRFFKHVNLKCNRLIQKGSYFLTESLDLVGLDYLWKV